MKKNLLLFISTVFIFVSTGCAGNSDSESVESTMLNTTETSEFSKIINTEKDEDSLEESIKNQVNNVLVAYFSATGNTENIANHIISITGADVFEIEAVIPYTAEDLDYTNDSCRANQEQNDKMFRPEISGNIENMENYDTVFIGYPIWWGEEPRIIDAFLESYDFSDKTVIPFCTSGGSDISASEANMYELTDSSVNWLSGKRFNASDDSNVIKEWIDSLFIGEGG